MDEAFAATPQGWPNRQGGTAWYADGAYRLQTQGTDQFVAIDAPLISVGGDVMVSARFRKTGGPPGGGYGLIVADQGPAPHDGVNQGGRFVVLEAGDDGTIGAWQREEDRWIDIHPWTPSGAVHQDEAANELMVRVQGQHLTFFVNTTKVAQVISELGAGRVGVFVGGDGNQVLLEHFAVQTAGATTLPASPAQASATPPAATPTPGADILLAQLDSAWAQGRWPEALTLLDRLEETAPTALDFRDKRYVAHVEAGQALLTEGNPVAAVDELTKAQGIDPSRGEATAALVALTPTATPAPTLARPQISPSMHSYLVYMYPRVMQIQYALETVSERSGQVGSNPSLIFTDDWRLSMAVALAGIKVAGNQIQQYEPVPHEFVRLDGLMIAYGKDLVSFADELAASIDSLSAARVNRAITRLQSANARAKQITAEFDNLFQQYGIPLDQTGDGVI